MTAGGMVGNASGCFKNGIILTYLSRKFFRRFKEGIRGHAEAAVYKLNQPICKLLFCFIFYLKQAWGRDLNPTVKGHSPI